MLVYQDINIIHNLFIIRLNMSLCIRGRIWCVRTAFTLSYDNSQRVSGNGEAQSDACKKSGCRSLATAFLVCYVKPDCLFIAVARFLLCAVGFGSGDQSEAPFVFPVCR